ncbi:hypothetical protein [Microcoleus sp.]|uniref:hypothetical protein n=1 Tax=Microcoleus sp. TaxID=44472 RepID=UPI003523E4D3
MAVDSEMASSRCFSDKSIALVYDAYLLLLSDDVSFSAKYGQVIFDKAFIFGIDIDGNFLMLTAEQVGTVKKELVLGSKAGGMFLEVWLDAE